MLLVEVFHCTRMTSGTTICLEKTVFFAASHCTFRAVPLPGLAQDPIGRNNATLLSRRVAAWAVRQALAGFNSPPLWHLELGLRRPMRAASTSRVENWLCTQRIASQPSRESTLNLLNFLLP